MGDTGLEGTIDVSDSLTLPLDRVGEVAGPASVFPTPRGVLLSRQGSLGLYEPDLSHALWRRDEPESGSWPRVLCRGETFVAGPFDGEIREYDLASGCVRRRIPHRRSGLVLGASQGRLLIGNARERTLNAVDSTGHIAWSCPLGWGKVIATESVVLQAEELNTAVRCIEANSGKTLWRTALVAPGKATANYVRSLAIVGRDAIAIGADYRVMVLSIADGQIQRETVSAVGGRARVSKDHVYFAQAGGMSIIELTSLREVCRVDYAKEFDSVSLPRPTGVCGFCVSRSTLVWSDAAGMMCGATLFTSTPRVWRDMLPGVLVRRGVHPVAHGSYVYYPCTSTNLRDTTLVAWASSSANPDAAELVRVPAVLT